MADRGDADIALVTSADSTGTADRQIKETAAAQSVKDSCHRFPTCPCTPD